MDNTGEYTDLRTFSNIKITEQTVIDTVATNSDSTILNVDENGDGRYDLKYKATENAEGELVNDTYLIYIYIAVGVFVLILIVIAIILIMKHLKSKNLSWKTDKACRSFAEIAKHRGKDVLAFTD